MAKQVKQEDLMARRQKELAILRAQNELLEHAKENVIEHYKDVPEKGQKYVEEIEYAQQENMQKGVAFYGAKKGEIENSQYGTADAAGIAEYKEHLKKRGIEDDSILYEKDSTKGRTEVSLEYGSTAQGNLEVENDDFHFEKVEMPEIEIPKVSMASTFTYDMAPSEPYSQEVVEKPYSSDALENGNSDFLPLPSNGECYPHKKSRIEVRSLTAGDENAITAPNLYRDGKVLDVILERTILKKNGIDPDDLISGDRDMILLWLRADAYGVDFPIDVRDPKTGKIFSSTADLSKIKTREFTLKGDGNGWFDYKTGNGDLLKFKYLTHKEEVAFNKSFAKETLEYRKAKLYDLYRDLMDEYDSVDDMSEKNKENVMKAINLIKEWSDSIVVEKEKEYAFDESLTEKMIANTMSVNGVTDREYIRNYIINMKAGEARKYRLYIQRNEPGMDFKITVNRPENLGGGSFETFLDLDSFIFLSVAEV